MRCIFTIRNLDLDNLLLIFLQFQGLQVYFEKQTSLVIHELLIWITDNNWKDSKEPFDDLQWQKKNLYYESSRLFLQIIMQWKCMHVRLKSGGGALASSWRVNFSSTISVVVTGDNQRTNPIHSNKNYFYKSCSNSRVTIALVYLHRTTFSRTQSLS